MVKQARRTLRKASRGNIVEKRPIYVTAAYAVGVLGAAVLILSGLFTLGGYLADGTGNISPRALLVWGGLVVLAVATWLWRRRKGSA